MAHETSLQTIEDITPAMEARVHEEIGRLATNHNDGLFGVLPYDPEKYSFQRLGVTHVEGVPQSIDTVHAYGRAAYKDRFDQCVEAFTERPDLIKTNKLLTDLGHNLILCTDHASGIVDIAIASGANYVAGNDPDRASNNHIIVSKITTRLAAFGVPAIDILQAMGNVWFSFPTTESIRQSGIDPQLAFICNQAMKASMQPTLQKGGNTVAVAPPGREASRKYAHNELRKLTIHGLGKGTMDLLRGSPVEAVHMWMGERHLFEVDYPLMVAKNAPDETIHNLMESFASRLGQHLLTEGVEVDYERERSRLSRLGGALLKRSDTTH